jgi:hypothetical protein
MAKKVICKIGDLKLNVPEATFEVTSLKTDNGIPKLELPIIRAIVRIDLNEPNIKFEDIQKLFNLSTALKKQERIQPMVLEFWTDLSQENPTVAYKFNGWISSFRTSNVAGDQDKNGRDGGRYNHFIDVEMTPDTTDANFKSVKVGN